MAPPPAKTGMPGAVARPKTRIGDEPGMLATKGRRRLGNELPVSLVYRTRGWVTIIPPQDRAGG